MREQSHDFTIKRELKTYESDVLSCLEELNLGSSIIPYSLCDGMLSMAHGKHCSRAELDVLKLYNDCLSLLYENKAQCPFLGLYAFYGETAIVYEGNQSHFLKRQLDCIYAENFSAIKENVRKICIQCKNKFDYNLQRAINLGIDRLSSVLLHGDLHLGNILLCEGNYKLIDFEYIRFGLKEIELAFMLCWDSIVDENIAEYSRYVIKRDLDILLNSGIINDVSAFIILEVMIPMFVVLACVYSSVQKYVSPPRVQKGIIAFYKHFFRG